MFALGYENAAIERYYLVPLMIAIVWMALALDAVWRGVETFVRTGGARQVVAVGGTVALRSSWCAARAASPARLPGRIDPTRPGRAPGWTQPSRRWSRTP